MKFKLTYSNLSDELFVSGFAAVAKLTNFSPDEFCWLCKALDVIEDELSVYNRARLALFRKWGEEVRPDEWRIDPAAPAFRFANFDFEKLFARTFEITLVRKIKLPKSANLSPLQYRALLKAGIVEPLPDVELPKEESNGHTTAGDIPTQPDNTRNRRRISLPRRHAHAPGAPNNATQDPRPKTQD